MHEQTAAACSSSEQWGHTLLRCRADFGAPLLSFVMMAVSGMQENSPSVS